MIKDVIKAFYEIKNVNGVNNKKSIIEANKHDDLFLMCLKFLLDDNYITGISEKKLSKPVGDPLQYGKHNISNFTKIMAYLSDHNTGKDEDVAVVQNFIKKQDEEDQEFYKQMVTKKFKLGCDKKIVNSVIPGLIPSFDLMLGTPIEKCNLKGDEWIAITRKLNGCRCAFVNGKFMTRQGKEYVGLDHIADDIYKMGYKPDEFMFDGELLYKNSEGLTDSEAFQKGTGIANSNAAEKPELKFVVFDMVPAAEFNNSKKSEWSYPARRLGYLNILGDMCSSIKTENIEVLNLLYDGYDHDEIWKWLDYAEENDWEGVMINLNTPYECKRTKNLIKVKKFHTVDILCTGLEEGAGKYKGTLGAIVCDYKGNELRVGSGFDDADRDFYWNNPVSIVGKIVEVKYKEETKNKDGGMSIQFPVFQGVRLDKSEPSYN